MTEKTAILPPLPAAGTSAIVAMAAEIHTLRLALLDMVAPPYRQLLTPPRENKKISPSSQEARIIDSIIEEAAQNGANQDLCPLCGDQLEDEHKEFPHKRLRRHLQGGHKALRCVVMYAAAGMITDEYARRTLTRLHRGATPP